VGRHIDRWVYYSIVEHVDYWEDGWSAYATRDLPGVSAYCIHPALIEAILGGNSDTVEGSRSDEVARLLINGYCFLLQTQQIASALELLSCPFQPHGAWVNMWAGQGLVSCRRNMLVQCQIGTLVDLLTLQTAAGRRCSGAGAVRGRSDSDLSTRECRHWLRKQYLEERSQRQRRCATRLPACYIAQERYHRLAPTRCEVSQPDSGGGRGGPSSFAA